MAYVVVGAATAEIALTNLLNCKAPIPDLDSAIADTGATSIYLTPRAPCDNINTNALKILVGTAGGPPLTSSASCDPLLPNLPHIYGHIMPQFHHNLMGIGTLCDHGCRVLCENKTVTVYLRDDDILLRGWREPCGAILWQFALRPQGHTTLPVARPTGPVAMNAHNLPSMCALVHYLHSCAGLRVRSMWLAAIKAGNFASWPGLTYTNAAKYFPLSVETLKGHMTHTRQFKRSTKPKPASNVALPNTNNQLPPKKAKELYVYTDPINKLYTDNMG